MASPYSTTTKSFRTSVDAPNNVLNDSGIGGTTKEEAAGSHDDHRLLPHGGEAAATRPPGIKVSQGVVVIEERADCENEVVPTMETLTLSPAVQGDETPPIFSIGNVVYPEEEVNTPGSNGAAKMVWLEQEWSPQDMKTKLSENVTTIRHLQKQVRSGAEQKDRMKRDFQQERDHYETVIASKNAEIGRLNNKVEECKVHISNLEKTNREEREKFESRIERLQKKVESKEQEINRIKEDFENKRLKFENDKMLLKLEISDNKLKISQMETQEQFLKCELAEAKTSTAVAERTVAENETAKVKVELERKTSQVEALTERCNSFSSSRSDSNASSVVTERSNSMGSCTASRSGSITSTRQTSDSDASSRSDGYTSMRQASDSGIASRSSSIASSGLASRSSSIASSGLASRSNSTASTRHNSEVSRSDSSSNEIQHVTSAGSSSSRGAGVRQVDSGAAVGRGPC